MLAEKLFWCTSDDASKPKGKIWITEAMGVRTEAKTPIPGEDCRAQNVLNETFLYLGTVKK